MDMDKTEGFLDPGKHALVSASAGTGKTWALTARILRLLLDGAPPDSILAITYTRAAAAEIRQRLTQRMAEWLHLDDESLDEKLRELKISNPNASMRTQARQLFEHVQFSEHSLHVSTFHSFFQDLLKRFPLEAGVPRDFQLPDAEQSAAILKQAIDQTLRGAEREPNGELAQALDRVIASLGWHTVRRDFFPKVREKMLEWAAFDEGQSMDDHRHHLEELFEASGGPKHSLTVEKNGEELRHLADLLDEFGGSYRTGAARKIRDALNRGSDDLEQFAQAIYGALFTGKGLISQRLRASAKTVNRGDLSLDEWDEYSELLERVGEQVKKARNEIAQRRSCEFNLACYTLIRKFAKHYQELKRNQGFLEYDDLLVSAHHMLAKGADARGTLEWVQLKLGQSFHHVLIDEFQDTDLMSWHTVHALFEALRECDGDDTEFIVGDVKQSIYQWRRANPAVLQKAREYLEGGEATTGSLNMSYRSAPAIMEFVNAWHANLECDENKKGLQDFQKHTTHLKDLYGRIELLPCPRKPMSKPQEHEEPAMRNPLQQSREDEDTKSTADRISRLIAKHLKNNIIGKAVIQDRDASGQKIHRHARYSDVMILVRRRTAVRNLECALADVDIPFTRQSRQTLLQTLEISDLIALLKFLLNPADNLSLAHVLRSPLYGASNEDLIILARDFPDVPDWIDRLSHYSQTHQDSPDHLLCRALRQLRRWQYWVGRIPTHDLLDQIYHEGKVLECYRGVWEGDRGLQAAHNLIRFMELALEFNSGRYPDLTAFVHYVEGMRSGSIEGADAPDVIAIGNKEQEDRVQIQTVHAAKGLESPIVIYVEMSIRKDMSRAGDIFIEWPAEQLRPKRFLINQSLAKRDPISAESHHLKVVQERRERLNVDYVAFTRAKQHLVLYFPLESNERTRLKDSIRDCSGGQEHREGSGVLVHESQAPQQADPGSSPAALDLDLTEEDKMLLQRTSGMGRSSIPNDAGTGSQLRAQRREAQLRGTVIHKLLEIMQSGEPTDAALAQVARQFYRHHQDEEFQQWLQEAQALWDDPELVSVFRPDPSTRVGVEVPVSMGHSGEFGRIDRLLVSDKKVWIIDFKSERTTNEEELMEVETRYWEQMRDYTECISRIYPDHEIRCSLLFTASHTLRDIAVA